MTNQQAPKPVLRVVVMGVSGCGKSSVGEALAARLDCRFLDADDFHPPANRDKMAAGIALTDEDRWPWLEQLAGLLAEQDRVVMACSALKRAYRDVLRRCGDLRFVYLQGDEALIAQRLRDRQGHFMSAGLLASQFAALEPPTPEETDIFPAKIDQPLEVVVQETLAKLPTI